MSLSLAAAAAIGAGVQGGTSLINSGLQFASQGWQQSFNAEEALKQREFSSAEAQKARDFEERMSNTAYQRQVADMIAAGLNPAAVGASGGASTPTVSSAQGYAASSSGLAHPNFSFGDLLSNAVSLAIAKDNNFSKRLIAEMSNSSARQVQMLRNNGIQANEILKARYRHRVYR